MELNDICNELKGLDFIVRRNQVRNLIEGQYHTGMGAIIQVVARKP